MIFLVIWNPRKTIYCKICQKDNLPQNIEAVSKNLDKFQMEYKNKVKKKNFIYQKKVEHDLKEYEKQFRALQAIPVADSSDKADNGREYQYQNNYYYQTTD